VDGDGGAVDLVALREPRRAGPGEHAVAVGAHALVVVVGGQAQVQRGERALRDAAATRREERHPARQVDRQVLAVRAEAHVTRSSTPSTGARWAYSKWAVPSATSVSRSIQPKRPGAVRSQTKRRIEATSLL